MLLWILLVLAISLEATVTTFPLLLLLLLNLAVKRHNTQAFFLAFTCGVLIDSMTFRTVGISGIFFTVYLFLVFLYERKFEIETPYFVAFAAFGGSLMYGLIFQQDALFLHSFVSSVVGVLLFALFGVVVKRSPEKHIA
jgi:rod shape-determining protein MreD